MSCCETSTCVRRRHMAWRIWTRTRRCGDERRLRGVPCRQDAVRERRRLRAYLYAGLLVRLPARSCRVGADQRTFCHLRGLRTWKDADAARVGAERGGEDEQARPDSCSARSWGADGTRGCEVRR